MQNNSSTNLNNYSNEIIDLTLFKNEVVKASEVKNDDINNNVRNYHSFYHDDDDDDDDSTNAYCMDVDEITGFTTATEGDENNKEDFKYESLLVDLKNTDNFNDQNDVSKYNNDDWESLTNLMGSSSLNTSEDEYDLLLAATQYFQFSNKSEKDIHQFLVSSKTRLQRYLTHIALPTNLKEKISNTYHLITRKHYRFFKQSWSHLKSMSSSEAKEYSEAILEILPQVNNITRLLLDIVNN